ncbi:MAG: urease accessory protein UreD [Myxococcota bacterium]
MDCGSPGQPSSTTSAAWYARLDLEVLAERGRSRLGARSHVGPLRVQRPFYPEGDSPLHLYLLHPPGGLVGGDQLEIALRLLHGAHALVTTPAAQKLYRSAGAECSQRVEIEVGAEACLEWLPAETIVFDGARAAQRTRVRLAPDAACVAWDIGCFGRPASGLAFARGHLRQGFELWRGAEPLLVERCEIAGGSALLEEAFGYAGYSVYGNLYAAPANGSIASMLVARLRSELRADERVRFAATALGSVVVVRALGTGAEHVRKLLVSSWQLLRRDVVGREPHLPRIWAT